MSAKYKKQTKQNILVALCLCAALAFAWGISRISSSQTGTGGLLTENIPAEKETPEKPAGYSPKSESHDIISKEHRSGIRRYRAVQQEGVVGNYAGRQIDNPADNIFTVNIHEEASEKDVVWLSYELSGLADYSNIPHSINDRFATGGYLVKISGEKTWQRERINPAWLKKGANLIGFSLPEAAAYGYKITNLSVEIEKGTNTLPLVVNSSGTSYNKKVYLNGYLQEMNFQGVKFYVGGASVLNGDGSFEAVVSLGDDRTVEVKAVLANGKEYTRQLTFTKETSADAEYAINNNIRQQTSVFEKGKSNTLELESAFLNVKPGALLLPARTISMATLRHIDLPALDMGLNNVTAEYRGYRFLPHGELFAEGATVSIKYDRTKIPNGFTEDDIRTYYFDLDTKHWVALERDTIDKQNQLVVSRTTHFTDMINGVIQTPESPETQGFAPTMMNDIKAADPTAKVQLIAPPTANNRGTAGLSYSFEMPPARNGMQPSLGVQYNSDGGSGWLGEGWDLSTPAISVDTRWGVPRYSDSLETETYSFNGSMLLTMDDNGESSVAHRGDKIARKTDRQFYPRNEGSFSRIIRKGSSPSNYTWEVTDKSGTKYTYGAILKGNAKTLVGDKEVIAEWKLTRVEELHGDWLEYVYETADEPVRGGLTAKAIYLKEVKAGNKGNDAHTVVTLTSTSQKDKKTNSARYGFLTSSNKLLDKVSIAFEGETLRSYTFEYKSGAFNTNVLTKINHIDSKGEVFASHDMDYYDDVDSKNGYKPFKEESETWNLHNDGLSAGFVNPVADLGVPGFSDKASALGGSVTTSTGGSFYAGVGLTVDMLGKGTSAGASINYSKSTTKGLSTYIDIDGDGLSDKVYIEGGAVYYRPNITKVTDSVATYGDAIKIKGINKISESKASSTSYGVKAHPGIGALTVVAGKDFDKSKSKTNVYFADINNDGLLDLVANGKVYFNHIEKDTNGNLIPTFSLSSADTPSPIMGGGIIDASDTEVDPQEQADLIKNSPLLDVVRVWEAPFDGTIKIEGNARLQLPVGDYDIDAYEKADGVRLAIQVGATERWSKVITKGDVSVYSTVVNSSTVTKGQKVYFRVQSGTTETANGSFDQVEWIPVITYTDKVNTIHANGINSYIFTPDEADFVSSETPNYILSDSMRITGTFVKPVTSDFVSLQVIFVKDNEEWMASERNFRWDEIHDGEIAFDVVNTHPGASLKLQVKSETNVTFSKIKWSPVITYNNQGTDISQPGAVYY